MEGGVELNPDHDLLPETQITEELLQKLNLGHDVEEENHSNDEYEEYDEEEEEGVEEFSFLCGESTSPIAAEDAFVDGQIKAALSYPVFNRAILLEDLPIKPLANKVFVEMTDGLVVSATPENGDIAGPYCDWSDRKAVEVETSAPDVCKKSNSTGFSKIWRFKEFLGRSNSDGKDTFVFLNNSHSSAPVPEPVKEKNPVPEVGRKVKRVKKGKMLSAHEVYMRNKAKESERRKSYLPYRPGVTGFFTSVNGVLTKNVHPF